MRTTDRRVAVGDRKYYKPMNSYARARQYTLRAYNYLTVSGRVE